MPVLAVLLLGAAVTAASAGVPAPANDAGQFRYLVEFAEPGALRALPREPNERFVAGSPAAVTYLAQLQLQQAGHVQAIAAALGRAPAVTHRYLVTHSGIAAWLAPSEAELVRALPGVVSVERERIETLATYRGPTFINADRIWDGSATPDGAGTRGLGIIVGVLDTGIDPEHPSFANDAGCGHGRDGAPDKLVSAVDCMTTGLDGRCNGPLPLDTQSHGTHVASTAAGNHLDGGADPAPAPFEAISGVASCASIRMYKVCPDISCDGSAIQAAMNNILLDGDVAAMNFSISGGANPWSDNDRRKLDLVDGGVMVAAAAGNHDPTLDPETVGRVNHRGPWVYTIAASTHDGLGANVPTLAVSGPGAPPAGLRSLPMIKGSSEAGEVPDGEPFVGKPIRHFDDPLGDETEGCAPFPPGFFVGAVALIKRGTCPFAMKTANAEAAGAEFTIIFNSEPGELAAWNAGAPTVPAYSLSLADGEAVAAWIAAHPDDATVDFDFIAASGDGGDVLGGFSLRGPTPAPLQNLTKPDTAAPGVNIFAAEPTQFGLSSGYGFKSGTSMATPHVTGAAALVRAVRPDWTAPEVKSALMMTASRSGARPDSTPWDADDVGTGRVDLSRAALAGLVMNEVFANFLAANPAAGGDVRTLNLPAVRDMGCTPSCTFTRTVRNTLSAPSSWTAGGGNGAMTISVSPSSFSFGGGAGETQQLSITVTPVGDQSAGVAFGALVLSEASGQSPDLVVTAAVRGIGGGPVDPPVTTVVDDADPAVEYRKGWHRRDDPNAPGGGYHRRMGNAGGGDPPSARLAFEGDRITYFYAVSAQGGAADVFINGTHAATVDYSGTASGDAPEFGRSVSFGDLGDGSHEFLLVFRSGAVYVDRFEIESGGDGGADGSAVESRSTTTAATYALPALGTVLHAVEAAPGDEWLSVVVEGAATALLVDPLGAVVAEGQRLVPGATATGADIAPAVAGTYTVELVNTASSAAQVEVSVARNAPVR